MKRKLIIGIVIIVSFFLLRTLLDSSDQKVEPNQSQTPVFQKQSTILVHLKGEVKYPGIYEINESMRLFELIDIAGGLLESADANSLNLVSEVFDGMVIIIPRYSIADQNTSEVCNKISINTATVDELVQLSGIGEARARSIVSYRQEKGRFSSIEDLLNISGISETILLAIKDDICL